MTIEMADRVKVVFIASLSHSGSTLLDLMLNAHPDVVSVGELKQLGRFARHEKPGRLLRCTCGAESLLTCEFWTRVSDLTKAATGRTIGELNVEDYGSHEEFDNDNAALFQAISAVTGKRYVVDSSKHAGRLSLLMKNPALVVFPIFLIRDPKGQIGSSRRKSESLIRLIENYVPTNREIHELVKNRQHAVVRYEQIVREPEQVLAALIAEFGVVFDAAQLQGASQRRHNVGGNGTRRSNSSELKLDEQWREHFTLLQKLAIDAATILARFPFAKSVHAKIAMGSP